MDSENPFTKIPYIPRAKETLDREGLREKMKDPSYLPTHQDVLGAFESDIDFSRFCFNEENPADELLNPTYELLNEEYLTALSEYLSERVEDLGASENSPIVILEVAAGSGRLSHFLRKKLEASIPNKFKIITTDSGELGIKPEFQVEMIDYKEALKKYIPKIVIVSWMPMGEDFTSDFRNTRSVEEYLLIGFEDCCGDDELTWGRDDPWRFDEDDEEAEKNSFRNGKTKPYTADGFVREDLKDLSVHQICRADNLGDYDHSSTVSFRRNK
jgi:hypothetical protein